MNILHEVCCSSVFELFGPWLEFVLSKTVKEIIIQSAFKKFLAVFSAECPNLSVLFFQSFDPQQTNLLKYLNSYSLQLISSFEIAAIFSLYRR